MECNVIQGTLSIDTHFHCFAISFEDFILDPSYIILYSFYLLLFALVILFISLNRIPLPIVEYQR